MISKRVDRAICDHSWETTDSCGLAVKCVVCKKTIGNLRHRMHKYHWGGVVATSPTIKPTPGQPPKKCDTPGCFNPGERYYMLGPGTSVWLCKECLAVQENIKG